MDLHDYLRVLRKRWLVVLHCVVLGVAAAALLVWRTTPVYEASTQLFVSAAPTASDVSNLAQGGQFTQQRVQSYAGIVNSSAVAQQVTDHLNTGLTTQQIAGEISAGAPPNTVLVNVHVHDTSAVRAQQIANVASDVFAAYVDTLEAAAGASTSPVTVTVVRRASLPTSPASPRIKLDITLGLLLGLGVGIGGAAARERLDTTVKDVESIQRALHLPALATIPDDIDAREQPLILDADDRSARAEAFRQLRTNLQFVDIDAPTRSVLVTSPLSRDGKTTTAANVALALARSGARVLLIDADLRRPRLDDYLGVEGAVGLTSVLIGTATVDDALQQWGEPPLLDVLPSGPLPPNPSELLGSETMAGLLRDLAARYDLVIVDAPPLLPVTDAAVLGSLVTGVIVVARYGCTRIERLRAATSRLAAVGARVYGAVLSMAPPGGGAGYYGYSVGGTTSADRLALPAPREDAEPVSTPLAR